MTGIAKRSFSFNTIIFIHCILLFCYVLYRAHAVSFTYDEVTTTQIANGEEWMEFGKAANNHILNVILMKGALLLFDRSDLVYRLPNVLGFILYLVYAVKLSKLLQPSSPYVPFILLTSMPFVLDFFSLARGYGLALSFALPSIYFLLNYCGSNKLLLGLGSLIFGMLAVLSNFTAFNYFLPLLLILFGYTLYSRKNLLAKLTVFGSATGAFFYFVLPIVLQLKDQGELYFGGRNDFYHDTILSLSRTFAYHALSLPLAAILFTLLFTIAVLFSVITLFKAEKKPFDVNTILPILFVLTVLSPLVQHEVLETSFPTERTALLYYPFMILVLVNGLKEVHVRIQTGLLTGLAVVFLSHTLLTSNFTHTYSWRFDHGSKEVVNILMEESKKSGHANAITLGLDYLYVPTVSHYKIANRLDSLTEHEVVHCWEYDMHIEELDPMNYGSSITRKTELSREDAERLVVTGLDYYYLNDFVVAELIRHGYTATVQKHFETAGSSLIMLR